MSQKQTFIANLNDLQKYSRDNVFLILGGDLILTAKSDAPIEGYSLWLSRKVSTSLLSTTKSATVVSYYIKKEAIPYLSKAIAKIAFSADVIIKQAKKIKGDEVCIVSATPNNDSTSISVYLFKKGILESISDIILSGPTSHTFEADLHMLIERYRLQNPALNFYWAGPIALPKSQSAVEVLPNIWATASVQGIGGKAGSVFVEKYLIPLFMVVASVAGYVGAIYGPYTKYKQNADILERESASLKDEYQFSSDRLEHLKAIDGWLKEKNTVADPTDKLNNLIDIISKSDKVSIISGKTVWNEKELKNGNAYGIKEGYNFELLLLVPVDQTKPVLSQVAPLVQTWSSSSGVSLSVVNAFAAEKGSSSQKISIQGKF